MLNLEKEYLQREQFDRFVKDFVEAETLNRESIDRFIDEIKILERFTMDSKRLYILFDQAKFYPVYLSQNSEKESGYSIDYFLEKGLFFFFQRIHWKQLGFAYKISKWGRSFQKMIVRNIPPSTYDTWICGLKLRDKWGSWRTFILKQKILIISQYNKPLLSFIEAEEITSIYKADFFWYRSECSFFETPIKRAYFSAGSKQEYNDILSLREIEVLKLAAKQKTNQEISELLNITKNTVERHRKNMIARVGVTDMTALIRIAQIVKII